MLKIEQFNENTDYAFDHYELPIAQMRFAGHPKYIIEKKQPGYQSFIIRRDENIIGVFALETGPVLKKMNAPDSAIYLRGLSINHKEQGKGYFKRALIEIEQYLKSEHPEITDIYLMVNVKNDAYYAFIKSGFIDQKMIVSQNFSKLKVLRKRIQAS